MIARRFTPLTRRQIDAARPALHVMLNDGAVNEELWRLVDLVEAGPPPLGVLSVGVRELAEECRRRDFDFARLYGQYLDSFLLRVVYCWSNARMGVPEEVALTADEFFRQLLGPDVTERLTPDNSTIVTASGAALVPPNATDQDLRDLRDYWRSTLPPKPRGRPPGTKRPAAPRRGGIDPANALRSFEMHQHGKHWREIATACLPAINLYIDGDLAYGRVKRLIERGRILSEKTRRIN